MQFCFKLKKIKVEIEMIIINFVARIKRREAVQSNTKQI